MKGDFHDPFKVIAHGNASPEAQVEYLKQLLHIANDKITTLEMKLETQKLEHSLWKTRIERDMEAQTRIYQAICAKRDPAPIAEPKKKQWWLW